MKGCAIVLGGVLLLMALTLGYCVGRPLPSDAAMKRQFQQSRTELERLRQMMKDDGLIGRIGTNYVDDESLSPTRVAEYRSLMSRVGIVRIWLTNDTHIEFLVDATGFLDVGTYKAFLYSEKNQDPVAESLDRSCMPDGSDGYCHAFQKLDGNWWLVRYEFI